RARAGLAWPRRRKHVRCHGPVAREIVYTDFCDELSEGSGVDLPGMDVGTSWERIKAKTRAYLLELADHIALQKLQRNKQLTEADLSSLEQILIDSDAGGPEDVARPRHESRGQFTTPADTLRTADLSFGVEP